MIYDNYFPEPEKRLKVVQLENKIIGMEYGIYYVIPENYRSEELYEMAQWCRKTFGPAGIDMVTNDFVWGHNSTAFFWFKEEENRTLFILYWS